MQVALAQAYDEYQWDFPEARSNGRRSGRRSTASSLTAAGFVAFEVLEPVLPRETAIQMAEAIAEAAWQVRARELASAA